jgi:hypothetical protein
VGVAVIALSADPTDPNPKGTLGLIFGLIGGFVLLLMLVQGSELAAAKREDMTPAVAPGTEVENPMTMRNVDLWAALATGPVGDEAAAAHAEIWGVVSSSRRSLWIVVVLIFVCVPMTYLLETFVPVLVGAALIAAVAAFAAIRVVGGGGGLDRGYDSLARSLGPLGLELDERPTVGVAPRAPAPGLKTDIRGALRFSGTRHGRPVSVVMEGGASEVRVGMNTLSFEARSSDGRIKLKSGGEDLPRLAQSLSSIPGSTEWKHLTVRGDADGLVVRRKPAGAGWLADLWLAERAAAAIEA